jgi:hypothetical protein
LGQAQRDTLDDGQARATFHLAKGLPMGEVIALGKDAARTGVSYSFSSGTNWGSGSPPSSSAPGDPPQRAPARTGGPVA